MPAMRSKAASMTAAPFNMVAIRMSWPGQSTKLTCRTRLYLNPFIRKLSSLVELAEV